MSAPSQLGQASALTEAERRQKALEDYRKRLIEHRELDAKLKKSEQLTNFVRVVLIKAPLCPPTVREELKDLTKEYDKSEEDLKALQSGVGQIVGEVLRQLTEDKCEPWQKPCSLSPSLSDFSLFKLCA